MNPKEKWFYIEMIATLEKISAEHKTNSISYVIGMLEHDINLEEKK